MITKKITKGAVSDFVRNKLKTSEQWAKAALLKIYEFQTADEQNIGDTKDLNNVGFSGVDGNIMSSFAEQLTNKGWLSPKQMKILMKRIHHYTRQIISVSDDHKLINMIIKTQ